jgi:hypothetical protein
MSKYLWKFYWYCGRQGDLDGLFVATEEEIKNIIGKRAYFGEVLGKHSEVYGNIEENDIEKIDLDSETVEKVSKILGKTWSGFNPIEYIKYECNECGGNFGLDEFNKEENMCVYCSEEEE